MEPIAQLTETLVPYFGAVAQISGSLVGLMFVALTFNIRALGLRGNPALSALARQTLSDFLLVLVVSLFMLVPHVAPLQIGMLLALIGAVGIYRASHSLLIVRRGATDRTPRGLLVQRFGLSLVGNAGIAIAGLLLLQASPNLSAVGSLLVSSPVMLILSGIRTAWLLVMHDAD